jgi:hypothetical protein
MLWLQHRATKRPLDTTSALLERVQRLEEEQTRLRARLEHEHQPRVLKEKITAAAEVTPTVDDAIEEYLPRSSPRGRAGGLARARTAWRYVDGTFMPESEKTEAYRAEYERYAAGGRARARSARRYRDGTFAP